MGVRGGSGCVSDTLTVAADRFDAWDVIKVPFPYTGRPVLQNRPALVVAQPANGVFLWVLMITSAANRPWPGDVAVEDLDRAGLPAPSLVRTAKIATIDQRLAEKLGTIASGPQRQMIVRHLDACLAKARGL
jgi:mRNA interferase MazF